MHYGNSKMPTQKFQKAFTLVIVFAGESESVTPRYVVTLTNSARLSVTQIDLRLAPNPEAVSAARRPLDRLEGNLPPEKLEDVRLIVSELVTNMFVMLGSHPVNRSHWRW